MIPTDQRNHRLAPDLQSKALHREYIEGNGDSNQLVVAFIRAKP